MAAGDVVGQFVDQVTLVGHTLGAAVPEVVVGIADGQAGLQGFFPGQGQPVVASEWHNVSS